MTETRFVLASHERARTKARQLQGLLQRIGDKPALTECQAAVARALGYRSWAEMSSAPSGAPSPLDEDAGIETWRARIDRQCTAIGEAFGLAPPIAAGVALALRLTSRARTDDPARDIVHFLPYPRTVLDHSTGPDLAPRSNERVVAVAGPPASAGEETLFVLPWEEIEVGWGERPDGYSVHASAADAKTYVKAYWDRMPAKRPAEYSAPCGDLRAVAFPADGEVAKAVRDGQPRFWQHESVPIREALAAAARNPAPAR